MGNHRRKRFFAAAFFATFTAFCLATLLINPVIPGQMLDQYPPTCDVIFSNNAKLEMDSTNNVVTILSGIVGYRNDCPEYPTNMSFKTTVAIIIPSTTAVFTITVLPDPIATNPTVGSLDTVVIVEASSGTVKAQSLVGNGTSNALIDVTENHSWSSEEEPLKAHEIGAFDRFLSEHDVIDQTNNMVRQLHNKTDNGRVFNLPGGGTPEISLPLNSEPRKVRALLMGDPEAVRIIKQDISYAPEEIITKELPEVEKLLVRILR
jgi:hypothetical protein